ncbi:tetrapyrrole biosynthesis, uroporphyrinogen III synthase [Syncephalastrum racemosum]|uniref:Tetrapyrrole biosynthesis, uroporphyrinogen III synthase n=1 Tax=Syncephalastrum racemosum TaxID=13706 RepID=A0A1X2HP47_SYNRA|nr:tetrapyrrole biosynthesis, uroporphyrinogen III synthase [Syncephalastrum racemosum]
MNRKNVCLFKARTGCNDEYETALRERGYNVIFVPVLDHEVQSIPELRAMIERGPDGLSGIIFTSQRAVEAWRTATQDMRVPSAWAKMELYIVGPKTASLIRELAYFAESHTTVANRASELGDHLVSQQHGRLLFLAGDKRRDELPVRLAKAGIDVQELRVYATCAHPQLVTGLAQLVEPLAWVVYYSPSGYDYVMQSGIQLPSAQVAAIGPTTADHLQRHQVVVHVVAEQPKPRVLADAIADYENKN